MKVFSDANTAKNIIEVLDENGDVMLRVTREYGLSMPAAEALAIEEGLFALTKQLFDGA